MYTYGQLNKMRIEQLTWLYKHRPGWNIKWHNHVYPDTGQYTFDKMPTLNEEVGWLQVQLYITTGLYIHKRKEWSLQLYRQKLEDKYIDSINA